MFPFLGIRIGSALLAARDRNQRRTPGGADRRDHRPIYPRGAEQTTIAVFFTCSSLLFPQNQKSKLPSCPLQPFNKSCHFFPVVIQLFD